MANFEAYEIERQGRALIDQTGYFNNACTNIMDYLTELSNQFRGTALETTISQFNSEYGTIKDLANKKYNELAQKMLRWSDSTIRNELETAANINKYGEQIKAMIDVLVRRRSGE